MARLRTPRLPGRHLVLALGIAAARSLREDWRASVPRTWAASRDRGAGFAIQPRDFRPNDAEAGQAILAGAFVLAGATLVTGVRGDPWNRPSPSRAFAVALHRFDWLPHLLAAGPDGATEALRLVLEWRRVFGRGNAFTCNPGVMARRVFNLACAGPALAARASEAETAQIAHTLAREARELLALGAAASAAERCACAAVAGAALRGKAGRKLLERSLARLSRALAATVSAGGDHASRQPAAALELLYDLETLDEAMGQRGLAAPDAVQRAIDRLAGAVRFFTLADGALASFHGGRACSAAYVAAARAQDEARERPAVPDLGGYQRLDAPEIQVLADVAPPPAEPWASQACAAPLAIEVLVGGRRLIAPSAARQISAASTMQVGDSAIGKLLRGFPGETLGPLLTGAEFVVEAARHEGPGAVWLDLSHHGWMRRYGLMHQRRLYVDVGAGELRGEDRLTPTARVQGPDGRHFIPYALRFQLAPGVNALVSQDRRSVLLRLEGEPGGWVLRNDALEIEIEAAPGAERPARQLVLRGQRRADSGARVRWKLAPARRPVAEAPAEAARRSDPEPQVLSPSDS